MDQFIGPMLGTLMTYTFGACIRYYSLRRKLPVSVWVIAAVYTLLFAAECVVLWLWRDAFTASYLSSQLFRMGLSILHMVIPFLFIPRSFFQQLFLYLIVFNYVMVVTGAGNYAERVWGGAFAVRYPHMICNMVMAALSLVALPVTLRAMNRLFELKPDSRAPIWRVIWLIPAIFAALGLMTANVFMGGLATTPLFLLARLLSGGGVVATCGVLTGALKQESQNVRLAETARMMEGQLMLQRKQFSRVVKDSEDTKMARHDLRHQLIAIKGYLDGADPAGAARYCEALIARIPALTERIICENLAAGAVISHYLFVAEEDGIKTQLDVDIPADTGQVSEQDLCVVIGNLMENAVEACRQVPLRQRRMQMSSRIQSGRLFLTLDNSFDGVFCEADGRYLSCKHEGAGIGLASVRTVAKQYGGQAHFESREKTFRSSVVIVLYRSGD